MYLLIICSVFSLPTLLNDFTVLSSNNREQCKVCLDNIISYGNIYNKFRYVLNIDQLRKIFCSESFYILVRCLHEL